MGLFDMTDTSADMQAINKYLMETAIVNPAAQKIKDGWIQWWHDHSGDLYWSADDFAHARNTRNEFNVANTKSPEEAEQVKQQIATGITEEEARGETKTANTSGMFYETPKPLIPTKWKVFGTVTALAIGAGYVVRKVFAHTPVGVILTKLFP